MKCLKYAAAAAAMTFGLMATPSTASAQDGSYTGEIRAFGNSFCPEGWVELNGQMLSLSQYAPLFSLIGTEYGGNGRTTFGVPDMRGRAPIGVSIGAPGITNRGRGRMGGVEEVTITIAEMPPHDHNLLAATGGPDTNSPAGASVTVVGQNSYETTTTMSVTMGQTTTTVGGGLPLYNMPPFTVVKYCMQTDGIYPPRP